MRRDIKKSKVKPLTKKMLEEILSRPDPLQNFIERARFMEEARRVPVGNRRPCTFTIMLSILINS